MTNRTPQPTRAARRSAGFSLVEILLSLGIFAIGMTAIVSLFPAAAILQRETTQEVIGGMAAESATSIINAQSLSYAPGSPSSGDLSFYHGSTASTTATAEPLPNTIITNRYTLADRSYPTGLVDTTAATAAEAVEDCDLHWVPFIQDVAGDGAGPNWVVRLFIVERDTRATYTMGNASDANPNDPTNVPKVRSIGITGISDSSTGTDDVLQLSAGTDIEASDIFMDSNGNTHSVVSVNAAGDQITVLNPVPSFPSAPNTIWYTPRMGGSNSPAQRIETVIVDVVAP